MIELDIREFVASARKHIHRDWPYAVAHGFSEIVVGGANRGRALTASKFKLHSSYIPQGIKAIPRSHAQLAAAQNALARHGDIYAAVYVRGATKPENSLSFMSDHEYGETRLAHQGNDSIAMPQRGVKSKSYRTGRGRVRKRWTPKALLKEFQEASATFKHGTTTNKGRSLGPQRRQLPGLPFLIKVNNSTMIVRAIKRNRGKGRNGLEFLYVLKSKAKIKKDWSLTSTTEDYYQHNYVDALAKYVRKMPDYRTG
jgi:hypothetical protein